MFHARAQEVLIFGHSSDVWSVSWHPTKPNVFATASDGDRVDVWDATERDLLRTSPIGFVARAVAFSAGPVGGGGCHIAVGGEKGHIKVRLGCHGGGDTVPLDRRPRCRCNYVERQSISAKQKSRLADCAFVAQRRGALKPPPPPHTPTHPHAPTHTTPPCRCVAQVLEESELRPVWNTKDSNQGISELRYSPNNKMLAAATYDQVGRPRAGWGPLPDVGDPSVAAHLGYD